MLFDRIDENNLSKKISYFVINNLEEWALYNFYTCSDKFSVL